eukprot:NODE_453_length_8264_cov_0.316105.p2 type:complete len:349 gc:universal NODE_453_length_8264_cov_0.316105:908-1954(+)
MFGKIAQSTSRRVGYWMMGTSGLVASIIVVGGITRLTESGLSITQWNLISGMKYPSKDGWLDEFTKYKETPEFKLLNHQMTLEEFKGIYFWEWAHRMLGRSIGLYIVIPGLYFIYKGEMTMSMRNRSLGLMALVAGQGALGWYMVKSGLDPKIVAKSEVPRVSPYRLASHLTSAFAIYCTSFYSGLQIFKPHVTKNRLYTAGVGLFALAATTVISGAFVAGLDAGLVYNTWPLMENSFIPSKDEILHLKPKWKNLFENQTTVQMDHRLLAYTTFASVVSFYYFTKKKNVHPKILSAVKGVMHMVLAQATLGITTLIYLVPLPLAAAHQAGSIGVLTTLMIMIHRLRLF